jgi:hypothetical protein
VSHERIEEHDLTAVEARRHLVPLAAERGLAVSVGVADIDSSSPNPASRRSATPATTVTAPQELRNRASASSIQRSHRR